MLNRLKQLAGLINLPIMVVIMLIVLVMFGMLFLIKKLSSNSLKNIKNDNNKHKEENTKVSHRKKKNKKSQQKQSFVSMSGEKPSATTHIKNEKSNISVVENTQETEVEKKKDKKKSKSKKKHVQNEPVPPSTFVLPKDKEPVIDDEPELAVSGEWQTVRNKEQRAQRKEKKRQDEIATLAPKSNPIVNQIPTVTSLPSTAKDVAPRFARAAGEDWPEGASKRPMPPSVTKSTTIVNRSPMMPASVQQQPSQKWQAATTTSIPVWEKTNASTSIGFSSTQSTTWSTNKPSVSAWNQGLDAGTWSTNALQKTWDTPGGRKANKEKQNSNHQSKLQSFGEASHSSVQNENFFAFRAQSVCFPEVTPPYPVETLPDLAPWSVVEKSDWSGESKSDDWVHVSTPSPTIAPSSEPWTTSAEIYSQQGDWAVTCASPAVQAPVVPETFQLEPEGLAVSTKTPDDPWNMSTYVKEGDWSPPEADWSNINDEWKVSIAPPRPEPTYFNESSDDEKTNPVANTTNPSVPNPVVGAGANFLAQNQLSKKTRRRRKKKQNSDISEVPKDTIFTALTIEQPKQAQVISSNPASSDPVTVIANTEEAWSLSKSSKKKKVRARKAE